MANELQNARGRMARLIEQIGHKNEQESGKKRLCIQNNNINKDCVRMCARHSLEIN